MHSSHLFREILFVGLGDFQQIPPVIKSLGPTATLEASIKSSPLWQEFTIYTLDYPHRTSGDPEYTTFVDHLGEDYDHSQTSLHLIQCLDTLDEAQQFLFPSKILHDPFVALKQAFLTPLNTHVDEFNEKMLQHLPGNTGIFFSNLAYSTITHHSQNYTTVQMSSKKMVKYT